MEKFSEYVNNYRQWKNVNHHGEPLDEFDMTFIRESYAAKVRANRKMSESRKTTDSSSLLKRYAAWKLKEGLGKINSYDIKAIRMLESKQSNGKRSMRESTKTSNTTTFQKALKEFAAFKEARGLGAVTRSERVRLFEKLHTNARISGGNKVTVQTVFNKLNESKKCVVVAKRRLSEGDVMGAADATMAAGQAVNGAEGDAMAMATPAAPVPQEVVDQISQVKTAVDALAAQAGIASPVDMGADPNAGVPAVTGAPADPNAMDPNAMMESRIAASRSRIAEAKCNSGKCGVEIPAYADLIKGTATGASKEAKPANTWPTEKIAEVPMTKKLGNVKENEEFSPDTEDKLDESKGLAEKRLEAEMAKRNFNWNNFLKSGFNKR